MKSWKQDLSASVVVFFVALPLCLGIASASESPLVAGLIAGVVGGILVGAISGSQVGVSGPAAGLATIVASSIATLGSWEAFLMAVVIAGGIQIVMGLARAGVLAYFFPSSVIKGMLTGIGITIILKQIPKAFGHDTDPEGNLAFVQQDGDTTVGSLFSMFEDITPAALGISLVGLAILILWDTVLARRDSALRKIPGPLVVVVIGVGYQWLTDRFKEGWSLASEHLVNVPVVSSASEFSSLLATPDWSRWSEPGIWVAGVTIAIVASLETLLCVEATDKLDPDKRVTPTNRELVAQGVGNSVSGLIGGLPVTQVIVRSSANIQSGGKTKVSAIVHGVLLAVFVITCPGLLNMIPLAALAAVLLVVGYKLARPATFRAMYAGGMGQFAPFLTTVLGIVFTDLLKGLALGLVVALFVILRAHYLNSHFLHILRKNEDGGPDDISIRFAEEVTFLNKAAILRELDNVPDGSNVTIDMSSSWFIDPDVLEIVADFEATAERRQIVVQRVTKDDAAPQPAS